MTTVTIGVATREEIKAGFHAMSTGRPMLAVGLIERDAEGFRFPYDAVHVDFVLKAA